MRRILHRTEPSPQQRLDLSTQRWGDVVALQSVGDVGGKKADLAAAVETAAFEFEPVERLLPGETDHSVRELDLTASATGLVGQNFENLRLQDVPAGDNEVRGGLIARRFLDHFRDLESLPLRLSDSHH